MGRAIATLIGIFLVSVAIAIPLAVALAWPVIYVSETVLHLGCESNTIDGQQVWVCPDGIGYVFPGLALGVVLTVIGVVTRVLWRRDALGPPAERYTLAMIISLVTGALALLVGAVMTLCGLFDVSAAYGWWLIPVGLAVAAASLAVLVALKQARLRATTNTIATLVVLGALIPVSGLGLPLVAALAGGFAVAAALYSTTRADRPSAALA
ncbi:hypothetical protein [Gordonia amicalis]|uniref:DUF998 domain-containing protein n=1 Tax=Gordonia amicalis TaxID=89053 RepID=A0AAE4R668_9ACTN|nr:hypothetical protein [Gordonia amicalis]MCZ4579791.1 hypothetical protein [Gordonia amicalis]MDJ0454545.1 hypothetical protein [Gordonia amicalis]MDV6312712.1 hypothetical protein [Gordonia amicalis]MDV7077808.1 hypothetical protein [Gordonia amicalis]